MNAEHVKSLLEDALPALEDFLKTILLKKFGATVVSSDLLPYAKVSPILKDKNVIVSAKDMQHGSEILIAYDDHWIPQLSAAMLGVEENEINEITTDLIKEFTTQLLSTAQISLAEKDISIKPEEVELLKTANVEAIVTAEEYVITEVNVEGKFEIEGDEKPELKLWFAFTPPKGAEKVEEAPQEEPNLEGVTIGGNEPNVQARNIQFDSFDPGANTMSADEVRNLELLRDVQIVISVELGRKDVPLGEILHMVRGSVVELEKLAGEPVDVYANGHQIATGEVVVIDEHFGVRITQLVSAKERLESLG